MKPVFGYCGMTADFLHIGHIHFLRRCKTKCDYLIVGIMSDDCVEEYKGKRPIMNQLERQELVRSIECVDNVTLQHTFDFPRSIIEDKEFIIFDSVEHRRVGADVILTRTANISSTQFRESNDYINNRECTV